MLRLVAVTLISSKNYKHVLSSLATTSAATSGPIVGYSSQLIGAVGGSARTYASPANERVRGRRKRRKAKRAPRRKNRSSGSDQDERDQEDNATVVRNAALEAPSSRNTITSEHGSILRARSTVNVGVDDGFDTMTAVCNCWTRPSLTYSEYKLADRGARNIVCVKDDIDQSSENMFKDDDIGTTHTRRENTALPVNKGADGPASEVDLETDDGSLQRTMKPMPEEGPKVAENSKDTTATAIAEENSGKAAMTIGIKEERKAWWMPRRYL